jgi:hypothetical protein
VTMMDNDGLTGTRLMRDSPVSYLASFLGDEREKDQSSAECAVRVGFLAHV